MKDEALKLALEALDIVKIHFTQNRHVNEAITAIKQALALDKMAENARALGLDYETYAEELEQPVPRQAGMISITVSAPVAYLCENAVGHKYFRWKKPSSTFKPIALYITPPAAQQDIQRLSALVRAQQITIDKLEQALAAPVQSCYCPNCEAMGKELAALKAQPAPVQEPVAWEYTTSYVPNPDRDNGVRVTSELRVAQVNALPGSIKPLGYTTPPAAPVQENTMIYRTFEQWKGGNVLEHGVPRTEHYSEDQLDLVEMGWSYGYDAGRAVERALDKKAENARELGLDYEPVGEAYLCDKCHTPFDGAWECPSCGHRSATKEPVYTTPPAQPAVPDAFGTREGEHPQYIQGWNDCRAEMLKGMK